VGWLLTLVVIDPGTACARGVAASIRGCEFERSTSSDPVFMRDFAFEKDPCQVDGVPRFACLIPDAIRRLIGALFS
jgi:hypothetical protein